jgi:hypothetical protein
MRTTGNRRWRTTMTPDRTDWRAELIRTKRLLSYANLERTKRTILKGHLVVCRDCLRIERAEKKLLKAAVKRRLKGLSESTE